MSGRLTKLAAGMIALFIAGAAAACPGAAKDKSAALEGGSSAQSSTNQAGRS